MRLPIIYLELYCFFNTSSSYLEESPERCLVAIVLPYRYFGSLGCLRLKYRLLQLLAVLNYFFFAKLFFVRIAIDY